MSLPSKVSKCGSPPPLADILWQYWPSHPPKHSHVAPQFGPMTGFPLPEQSKNDKRYLSCRFDGRKTEIIRRSTYTNQQHRPCTEFPDKRATSGKITRTNLTPSQNQYSIKAQSQAAEYVDIHHATNLLYQSNIACMLTEDKSQLTMCCFFFLSISVKNVLLFTFVDYFLLLTLWRPLIGRLRSIWNDAHFPFWIHLTFVWTVREKDRNSLGMCICGK